MSSEEVERYEAELELALYKEYRDVIGMFRYVVETGRRFYLANEVRRISEPGADFLEYEMTDAWVWDMYRQSRFLTKVTVSTTQVITVEELPPKDL
ncbi:MAG: DUF2469 domain-containing protein [Acidimicrobiia bacterium]|nr:DUF2469 domain-containing protein [Acidimicrobiia bacterium]